MSPTSYQTAPPRVVAVNLARTPEFASRRSVAPQRGGPRSATRGTMGLGGAGGGGGGGLRVALLLGLVDLGLGVLDLRLVGGEVAVLEGGIGVGEVLGRLLEQ